MKKSLSIALGTTFIAVMLASPVATADVNPFGIQNQKSSYIQVADGGKKMQKKSKKRIKAARKKCS